MQTHRKTGIVRDVDMNVTKLLEDESKGLSSYTQLKQSKGD